MRLLWRGVPRSQAPPPRTNFRVEKKSGRKKWEKNLRSFNDTHTDCFFVDVELNVTHTDCFSVDVRFNVTHTDCSKVCDLNFE